MSYLMKSISIFIFITLTFNLLIAQPKKKQSTNLDNLYFEKNQNEIIGDTKNTLDYNISLLKKETKKHIVLYAYLDNLESEINKNIHKQRLKATLHYLEKAGIDLTHIHVSEDIYHHETKLYFGNTLAGDLALRMNRKITFKLVDHDIEQDEMIVTAYTFLNKHHDEIHNIIVYAKHHTKMSFAFKIQVGALSNATKQNKFSIFQDIQVAPYGNGLFRYTTGNFSTIHDAVVHLTYAQQKGFHDAFIILYKDNKFIHPEELEKKMLSNK